MSKLSAQDKFWIYQITVELSEDIFALQLKDTRFTPIHVTLLLIIRFNCNLLYIKYYFFLQLFFYHLKINHRCRRW
jgi:hypothetical protein